MYGRGMIRVLALVLVSTCVGTARVVLRNSAGRVFLGTRDDCLTPHFACHQAVDSRYRRHHCAARAISGW